MPRALSGFISTVYLYRFNSLNGEHGYPRACYSSLTCLDRTQRKGFKKTKKPTSIIVQDALSCAWVLGSDLDHLWTIPEYTWMTLIPSENFITQLSGVALKLQIKISANLIFGTTAVQHLKINSL